MSPLGKRAPGVLSWRERLGFCTGGFGFNILFQTAAMLLMFYYTDVLGLSPAVAGYVFAGALVWDALVDPYIGYLANRTKTRWGRYRPYLLLGAVPLAISWVLVFVPTGLEGVALIVYATVAHILFRTVYALVNMPYLSMQATISKDSQERGVISGLGIVFAAASTVFSSFVTLKLVEFFGGGQSGFFVTAIIYGALSVATILVAFSSTNPDEEIVGEDKPSASDMARMLRGNRAFWIVATGSVIAYFGATFFSKTLPYYFKYNLGREDLISAALGCTGIGVMVAVPFWVWVMKKWSKRTMWLAGGSVELVGLMSVWFATDAVEVTLVALFLRGFGSCAIFIGFWAMMADTVEYGEWRSGVRAEGAIFGFVSLIGKTALGIAAAALGETLTFIGYQPNQMQSAATLESMRVVMIVLPAVLSTLGLLVIAFYPIDRRLHGRLVRALDWKRSRRSVGVGVAATGMPV